MRSVAHAAIPANTNRALLFALVGLHMLVLFALPELLVQSTWYALVLVPIAWLNVMHWALIHEAIHKLLFHSNHANEIGGRVLGILMGPSFHVLRFGHLMHHKLNRHWHAETVERKTIGAWFNHYYGLFCGLYIMECTTSLMLAILPRTVFMRMARASILKGHEDVAVAGERFFYTRGNVWNLRLDIALTFALYGAAFWLYGAAWPVLVCFIALRALVISFMDNIYHHATPLDNSKAGKELALPEAVSASMLYGNYHETHHRHPDTPWQALPALHKAENRGFDGAFIDHARLQFSLPVNQTSISA